MNHNLLGQLIKVRINVITESRGESRGVPASIQLQLQYAGSGSFLLTVLGRPSSAKCEI